MQFQNLCTDSELPFSLKIAQKDIILIFYHFYDFFFVAPAFFETRDFREAKIRVVYFFTIKHSFW